MGVCPLGVLGPIGANILARATILAYINIVAKMAPKPIYWLTDYALRVNKSLSSVQFTPH